MQLPNRQPGALVVNYGTVVLTLANCLAQDQLSMIRIHPTAELSTQATVGDGTQIWHQAQVREDAHIGRNCILGKGVYVDFGVRIGDNCKLQNGAFVYHGATLEDGVFVGPGAFLTNDKLPRAINPDGSLKSADDWDVGEILVRRGASLGAGCIVLARRGHRRVCHGRSRRRGDTQRARPGTGHGRPGEAGRLCLSSVGIV